MTRLARPIVDAQPDPARPSPSPRKVYDRSSFEGDFLVQIPGQTAEDFELYAPESRFCEFFDGTVYMPSPVSDHHQRIVGFLLGLLDGYRWSRPPGLDLLFGPAVLRLAGDLKPEPDIFIAPMPPGDVPALLVIEVLSPSHRSYDVIEVLSPSHRSYDLDFKAGHYKAAKIPEIWYVDHANRTLIRDILCDIGYSRQEIPHGRVAPAHLPGFWIDVGWLWSEPLPNPRACLDTILANPPA
ncbi:MAG: Uma2 family endonuclease [Isosphaeraceae bacterium]